MAVTTLPSFTRTIDNAFTETWYDIKAQAADNIINATPVWALLKARGCFKTQVGGTIITRTIDYALPEALEVAKGDLLSQGETETTTMAIWPWRYLSIHVQRDLFDDQQNAGQYKITDYVTKRITKARDALVQRYESDLMRAAVAAETGKNIFSLNDLVPKTATRNTGTYGKINRPTTYTSDVPTVGNTWWSPKYQQFTAPLEVNLLADMKKFYNTVTNQQEAPNVLVTTKTMYELYEDFALDAVQIVKDDSTMLADLGFEVLRFKGKPFVWTPNMDVEDILYLNTNHIDVMYDPGMYFDMTDWKPIHNQTTRIAHILCTMTGPITDEPRRHGRLYS